MTTKRWVWGLATTAGVAAAGVLAAGAPRQQATFRAAVDLVAVDVQVVNNDGVPVANLGPDNFEVSIDGQRRRVVSVDFIRHVPGPGDPPRDIPEQRGALPPPIDPAPPTTARVYMIAFDVNSFDVGESRGVVTAARAFLHQLQPDDLVGLYAYPLGPKVDPTTDRLLVDRRLDTIVGGRQGLTSEFHLTPTEIIDINAEVAAAAAQRMMSGPASGTPQSGRGATATQTVALTGSETETVRRVQQRECDADLRCVERIESEAQALAFLLEGQILQGLSGLSAMLRGLGELPGRKTVVLLSAGVPASDRPGGRPDAGNMAELLARNAAEANASVYAVHVDSSYLHQFTAEVQKSDKQPVSRGRDNSVLGRLLDQFAGESGGSLLRVLVGSGESAFQRIVRETSSHYLLGVQPADADRDGKLRPLRVKVNQRNVTVRSRQWVVVPKRRA